MKALPSLALLIAMVAANGQAALDTTALPAQIKDPRFLRNLKKLEAILDENCNKFGVESFVSHYFPAAATQEAQK